MENPFIFFNGKNLPVHIFPIHINLQEIFVVFSLMLKAIFVFESN